MQNVGNGKGDENKLKKALAFETEKEMKTS